MEQVAKIQVMKKHVNKFLKNILNNVLLAGITKEMLEILTQW